MSKIRKQINKQVYDEVTNEIYEQILKPTRIQTLEQMRGQMWSRIDDQIRRPIERHRGISIWWWTKKQIRERAGELIDE